MDLTINYSNTGADVITACDSYTWIDGVTYTSSTNLINNYTLFSNSQNPGGLNNDSEFPSGSGLDPSWTVILGPNQSNPAWSVNQTIPFSFEFNGNPVTHYKVSSTGVLTFDTSTTLLPGPVNTVIPNSQIPNNSIMIWGIQGIGSNDNIVTKTFGNVGDRQYWVFFSSYTAGSWSYWSIVFEETTNKVYIVDQRHSGSSNPQITAGIQYDNTNAIMIAGSPMLSNLAGSDASPLDNHYYEFTNNTLNPSFNLTNITGCDSVVTLDLTINYSNTGIDTITACDSHTWIDGNTYTSSNNTATHTLTNIDGCDSLVTLDLTINYSNTGIDAIIACDSYTWIDGITYTSSNNTATHTLTNEDGCDSVVTMDLVVNYSIATNDSLVVCDSAIWNGNLYNTTGIYVDTLQTVHGCDSIVTMDMTINYSIQTTIAW